MLNLSFVLSANHSTLNQKETLTGPGWKLKTDFSAIRRNCFGSVDYVYFLTPYPHFSRIYHGLMGEARRGVGTRKFEGGSVLEGGDLEKGRSFLIF